MRIAVFPAFLLLVVQALLAARAAHADCGGPPAVLWTYPENLEVDVPLNSRIWVRPVFVDPETIIVTLDGLPLVKAGDLWGFSWNVDGLLEPETEYLVRFVAEGYDGTTIERQMTFTSGTEAEAAPPLPVVVGFNVVSRDDYPQSECRREIMASGCYDSGEDTFYLFEMTGEAFLWRTSSRFDNTLTRSTCERPLILVAGGSQTAQPCVLVEAIGKSGATAAATEYCANHSTDAGTANPPTTDAGVAQFEDAGGAPPPSNSSAFSCASHGSEQPSLAALCIFAGIPAACFFRSRSRRSRRDAKKV